MLRSIFPRFNGLEIAYIIMLLAAIAAIPVVCFTKWRAAERLNGLVKKLLVRWQRKEKDEQNRGKLPLRRLMEQYGYSAESETQAGMQPPEPWLEAMFYGHKPEIVRVVEFGAHESGLYFCEDGRVAGRIVGQDKPNLLLADNDGYYRWRGKRYAAPIAQTTLRHYGTHALWVDEYRGSASQG